MAYCSGTGVIFPTKNIELQNGERYLVKINYVERPVDFYISFVRDRNNPNQRKDEEIFSELYEDLNRVYSKGYQEKKLTPFTDLHRDDHCVFQSGRSFYRGRVLKINEKNKVDLVDVDSGDQTTCNIGMVYPVWNNAVLRQTPMFAIRCKLGDVAPVGSVWNEEDAEAFKKHYIDREFVCEFVGRQDDIYVIKLFFKKNEREVADHMLAIGIGRRPKPEIPTPVLPPLQVNAAVGDWISVIVSYVESTSKFFVQLIGNEDLISSLSREINLEYCKNSEWYATAAPIKGGLCACKYVADGHWYRAYIINRPSPMKVEVLYIDYGNKSVVLAKDIKELERKFHRYPAQAVECELSDVASGNVVRLRRVVEGKRAQIKIVGASNNILRVELYLEDININEYLSTGADRKPVPMAPPCQTTNAMRSNYAAGGPSSRRIALYSDSDSDEAPGVKNFYRKGEG